MLAKQSGLSMCTVEAEVRILVRLGLGVGEADELGTVPQLLNDQVWVDIADTGLHVEHDS